MAFSEVEGSDFRTEVCIVIATTVSNYRPIESGSAESPVAYSGTL
jgi:hypothetical protein